MLENTTSSSKLPVAFRALALMADEPNIEDYQDELMDMPVDDLETADDPVVVKDVAEDDPVPLIEAIPNHEIPEATLPQWVTAAIKTDNDGLRYKWIKKKKVYMDRFMK